jgi:cell fate (sporulation/competence/biofilm development) regulator YlbF (YheA/YmcA/DUF963 family)
MSQLLELARDLGQALGRTEEHQALRRALKLADEERELVETRNRLDELTRLIEGAIRSQKEPESSVTEEYEQLFARLQAHPAYQRLVAAQANFEKVMARVNRTIEEGLEEAAGSRIIIPS